MTKSEVLIASGSIPLRNAVLGKILGNVAQEMYFEMKAKLRDVFAEISPCEREWSKIMWDALSDDRARFELLHAATKDLLRDFNYAPVTTLDRTVTSLNCAIEYCRNAKGKTADATFHPSIEQIHEVIYRLANLLRLLEWMMTGQAARNEPGVWEQAAFAPFDCMEPKALIH